MRKSMIATATALAALTACSDDNGIEVTGYLDGTAIEVTASEPINDTNEVLLTVVGRPGAAANFGQVLASNLRVHDSHAADVTPTGSFVLQLPALLGDQVQLRHSDGDDVVDVTADALQDFPQIQNFYVGPPSADHGASIEIQFTTALTQGHVVVLNYDNEHVTDLHELETDHTYHVGTLPAHSGDHAAAFLVVGDGNHSLGHEFTIP